MLVLQHCCSDIQVKNDTMAELKRKKTFRTIFIALLKCVLCSTEHKSEHQESTEAGVDVAI